jgi:hypothetical protein
MVNKHIFQIIQSDHEDYLLFIQNELINLKQYVYVI